MLLGLSTLMAPNAHTGYRSSQLRYHHLIGSVVVALALLHGLWLLIENDVAIEYLQWRAPIYMHAGNLALLGLLFLGLHGWAPLRRRWHRDFRRFTRLHRALTLIVLLLATWHIVGSGYLLAQDGASVLFAFSVLAVSVLWWRHGERDRWPRRQTAWRPAAHALVLITGVAVLIGIYLGTRG